jgi:hypothetical protein
MSLTQSAKTFLKPKINNLDLDARSFMKGRKSGQKVAYLFSDESRIVKPKRKQPSSQRKIYNNKIVQHLNKDSRWAIYEALFNGQEIFQILDDIRNPLETLAIAIPELGPEIDAFKSKYVFGCSKTPDLKKRYYTPHLGHFEPWNTTFSIDLRASTCRPLIRRERLAASTSTNADGTPDFLQLAFNKLSFKPGKDTLIDVNKTDFGADPEQLEVASYIVSRSMKHILHLSIDLRPTNTSIKKLETPDPPPLQILTEGIMPYMRFLPNLQSLEVIMTPDQLKHPYIVWGFALHHVWDNFWKLVRSCHPGKCCTCCGQLPELKFKSYAEGFEPSELMTPYVRNTMPDGRFASNMWYNPIWDNSEWEGVPRSWRLEREAREAANAANAAAIAANAAITAANGATLPQGTLPTAAAGGNGVAAVNPTTLGGILTSVAVLNATANLSNGLNGGSVPTTAALTATNTAVNGSSVISPATGGSGPISATTLANVTSVATMLNVLANGENAANGSNGGM